MIIKNNKPMSIPNNNIRQALCLAIILQAFAPDIAAAGSEAILAASILLLAGFTAVFTTLHWTKQKRSVRN